MSDRLSGFLDKGTEIHGHFCFCIRVPTRSLVLSANSNRFTMGFPFKGKYQSSADNG